MTRRGDGAPERDAGATPRPSNGRAMIFTNADAGFYPGLVALLHSLERTNPEYPVTVVDTGLTGPQRRFVEQRAHLRRLPVNVPRKGTADKMYLSALDPSGVVVWIDSDCVVLDSIAPVVEAAENGLFCAARDADLVGVERWHPRWETLFDLAVPPRRGQTYVNAGLFSFSTDALPALLRRLNELASTIDPSRTFQGEKDSNPIWAADQDAINALLMSEVAPDVLHVLPEGAMAYAFDPCVRVVDTGALDVRRGDARALVVHYSMSPKPWQRNGWQRVGREPASEILVELLAGSPAFADDELPPWLLRSRRGDRARSVARSYARLEWPVRELRRRVGAARLSHRAQNVPAQ